MENMTKLSIEMYENALHVQSVSEALSVLKETGNFRSLGDILKTYTASEKPKEQLVDGLMKCHPDAKRDSMDKKVRNWLNGRTRTIGKSDAFELAQIMGLSLERTDEFLKKITGEGIHWRDPEEILRCYAIWNKRSFEETGRLLEQGQRLKKQSETTDHSGVTACTEEVRSKVEPLLEGSEEQLLDFLTNNVEALGTLHHTAYQLFLSFMELLEAGSTIVGVEASKKMGVQEILREYLYRHVIVGQKGDNGKSAVTEVQRAIKMNWPDEATISKMKNREVDVSRKVLILLFLATDGSNTDYEELDEDEELMSRDEIFQNIYTRLNRMLQSCGFQLLDPRSPFDWVVIYSICVDDILELDRKIREILTALFSTGTEIQA